MEYITVTEETFSIQTRLQANMANTYIYQKKTAWIATPPHVLDHRKKVEAVTGK
jgi:hypothetical protein